MYWYLCTFLVVFVSDSDGVTEAVPQRYPSVTTSLTQHFMASIGSKETCTKAMSLKRTIALFSITSEFIIWQICWRCKREMLLASAKNKTEFVLYMFLFSNRFLPHMSVVKAISTKQNQGEKKMNDLILNLAPFLKWSWVIFCYFRRKLNETDWNLGHVWWLCFPWNKMTASRKMHVAVRARISASAPDNTPYCQNGCFFF